MLLVSPIEGRVGAEHVEHLGGSALDRPTRRIPDLDHHRAPWYVLR